MKELIFSVLAALYLLYRGGRAIEFIKRFFVDRSFKELGGKAAEIEKEAQDADKKSATSLDDYRRAKSDYDSGKK